MRRGISRATPRMRFWTGKLNRHGKAITTQRVVDVIAPGIDARGLVFDSATELAALGRAILDLQLTTTEQVWGRDAC